MRFSYGEKARDKITGYEGVVTGVIHHFGMRPDSYILESVMKEGYVHSHTVDENRLVPVDKVCTCKATRVHLCED